MATQSIQVNTNSSGEISAVSSDVNVATATINGKSVVVDPRGPGECNLIISIGEDPNYTTPNPVVCKIKVKRPEEYNGEEIKQIVQAGQGLARFRVGDRWPVKMKGRVGILDIDGTYYVALIGLNHNQSVETQGKPNAHFKFPYDQDGKQLAFCDSEYNMLGEGPGFRMNPGASPSNVGGWEKSYALNTLSPQILNILEESWRNAISDCVKYTDNVGNATGSIAANVTPTTQKIFYLSQWEVFADETYTNTYEKDYQKQYAYYANGNNKVHYRHDQPTIAVWVWERSPYATDSTIFRVIYSSGAIGSGNARYSGGAAPAFSIH